MQEAQHSFEADPGKIEDLVGFTTGGNYHIEGTIEEYSKECHCRKPNPGMIKEASSEFGIDLKGSFVIGDKISDIEAGHRAGCKTILLAGEDPLNNEKEIASMPDYIAPDLYEAVNWLTKISCQKERRSWNF